MSAGQNLRRGYAYGVSTAVHSGTIERRSSPDMVSLIVLGKQEGAPVVDVHLDAERR